MFQKYQFYYRFFHINKLSSRTFSSCWRNSTTTFAGQLFQQILLSKNNCQLRIIPFNHQQLCQHNQFSSGNVDGVHLFSIKKTNSSNILTPAEMAINNAIQKQQYSDETEKQNVENEQTLEAQMIGLDYFNKKQLKLKLEMGKSGQKIIVIAVRLHPDKLQLKNSVGQHSYFPNISVPQDAYAFVRALDELIVELATENFEQKILCINDHRSTTTTTSKNDIDGSNRKNKELKLHNVELICRKQKFQLELLLFSNKDNGQKQILLRLLSFNEMFKSGKYLNLPLQALPWLRKQMAKMLAKYDGTEAIALEAPAQIPKQFLLRDVAHTHLASNGISLEQKMQQNRNRPQSINKNSKFVQQYSKMPTKMQNSNQSSDKKHNMATVFASQQKDIFHTSLAPNDIYSGHHQKRMNPATQNGISFGGKLKKANGPKNEYQFNERSIKEIDGSLANMEKALMELSKENVGLKKEILGLKREIKDVFHAHPASNFNFGHKLEHKGIQPQFVNKKPVSFIKEIGENMANMQKELMEIREEKGELNKEIRHLKREINDVFHAPPIPNGISFGHSLKHNEMQPQITKKPSIFQQYSKMPNKMQNSNQSGHPNILNGFVSNAKNISLNISFWRCVFFILFSENIQNIMIECTNKD